jgi:hypothetical protein
MGRHVARLTNGTIGRLNALHDGRVSKVWPPPTAHSGKDALRRRTRWRSSPDNLVTLATAPAAVRRIADRSHHFWRINTRERGEGSAEHDRHSLGDALSRLPIGDTRRRGLEPSDIGSSTDPISHVVASLGAEGNHAHVAPLRDRTERLTRTSLWNVALPLGPSTTRTSPDRTNGAAIAAPTFDRTSLNDQLLELHPPAPYAASNLTPLIAERIGMPSNPGAVPLTHHMDSLYRARYESAAAMLKPADDPSFTARSRGRVGGSDAEYLALIRKCVAAGMWGFFDSSRGPPPVECGVFAVKKDEKHDRLIIDARPANERFVEPPAVALPTPDVVTELYVDNAGAPRRRAQIFVAKTDLSDYYHQLRLPEWCTDYFCLPPVRRSDVFGGDDHSPLWPKSLVLPMGWSHSVVVAQLIHERIVAGAGLFTDAAPLTRLTDGSVGDGVSRVQVYIDDVVFYGTDRQAVEALQARYIDAIGRSGLTVKPSKTIPARASPPVKCVGVEVDGDRLTAGVAAGELHALIRDTHVLLTRVTTDHHELSSIVGSWNWALTVRRSSMCVFQNVYSFISALGQVQGRRLRVWPSAREELMAACDLAPLLSVSLNPEVSATVVATDASSDGFGVAAADVADGHEARRFSAVLPSAQTLKLMAAARQPDASEARSRALATLEALSRSASDDAGEFGTTSPLWMSEEMPCVAAAANSELVTRALRSMPPGFRLMDAAPGSGLEGFGEAYRRLIERDHTRGLHREWRVALSGRWERTCDPGACPQAPEHINCLEVRTAGYGIGWALRNFCRFDSRFVMLLDSSVALGALTKGRSSSFPVLRCVRRISALLLATGVRPLYRFVESEANPADLPSRCVLERGTRYGWPQGHTDSPHDGVDATGALRA